MKTIVITGASSGIGLETAHILAQQGFEVLGIARSEPNCIELKKRYYPKTPMQKSPFFWLT
jgi:short-subunit dehydrogenase